MELLYGKPVADKILSRLKSDIALNIQKPCLAVILVGNDKASHLYVSLKEKKAHEIGMNFFRYNFFENAQQSEVLECIEKLNADQNVHGIIVQLPMPKGFEAQKIIDSIDPEKDADGFSAKGGSAFGGNPNLIPVFPRAIMKMITSSHQDFFGKKAVVLTNSDDFGRIMCAMLEGQNIASQYILSANFASQGHIIRGADIVVSAVGSPGLLKGGMFKEGAIVVDGGIKDMGEKVLGDADFGSTEGIEGFITPVPGGVGPLTIACLLENVYLAFEAQQKGKKN